MKKILVGIIVAMLLVGCSSSGGSEANIEDVKNAVYEKIKSDIQEHFTEAEFENGNLPSYFVKDLMNEDEREHSPLAELDYDKIKGAFSIEAMMMVRSDRIYVVQVSDSSYLEEVKEVLEADLKAQNDLWGSYLPDQHELVKANILETEGNLIYYITYLDAEGLEQSILEAIK